jgi:hypothetical protein
MPSRTSAKPGRFSLRSRGRERLATLGAPRWRSGFTLSLLVAVVLGCTGIREDELACETAVAHLQQCCSGYTGSNIDCVYSDSCSTTYPQIDDSQSACIRGESCDGLVATGVCTRAAALTSSGGGTVTVCP